MSQKNKNLTIFDLNGASEGKTKLPKIFMSPIRPDVIKRAVLAIQSPDFNHKGVIQWRGKRLVQNHAVLVWVSQEYLV